MCLSKPFGLDIADLDRRDARDGITHHISGALLGKRPLKTFINRL